MRSAFVVLIAVFVFGVVLRTDAQTMAYASYQPFEHGFMLYYEPDGTIFAFVDTGGGGGRMTTYGSAQYGRLPNDPVTQTPPSGLYRPILGIGKVWGHNTTLRRQLGWATAPESAYTIQVTSLDSVSATTVYSLPNNKYVSVTRGSWTYTTAPAPVTPVVRITPSATPNLGCSRTGGGSLPMCPVQTMVPTGPVVETQAAFQWFDGGFMIWRADTEEVLVFLYQQNVVQRYAIGSYVGLSDNPVTDTSPELGVRPINAFGRIWGNFSSVRSALNWGSSIELSYTLKVAPIGESFCINRPQAGNVLVAPNGRWTDQSVSCGL